MHNFQNRIPDAINSSPSKNFTQISNTPVNDNILSAKATGILLALLSNKNGHWISYMKGLQAKFSDGIDSLRSGIQELEKRGYLLRISYVDKRTKAKRGSFWSYTDEPYKHDMEDQLEWLEDNGMEVWGGNKKQGLLKNPKVEKPYGENPYMGSPNMEKLDKASPTLIIPNSNNIKNNNTKLKNTKEKDTKGFGRILKKKLDDSSDLPIKPRIRSTQKEIPPYEEIQEAWNEAVNGTDIPKVIKLTNSRKKHINARMEDLPTLKEWQSIFQSIVGIPFLCGENDRGWTIDFDWFIGNDTNFAKIIEGKYKSSKKKQSDTGNTNWGVSYPKSDEEREEMFARLEARTIHYNNDPREARGE